MKDEVKKLAVDMNLRMFMRDPEHGTYAYLTDGQRIAYVQWGRSCLDTRTTSVHVPNKITGTGFVLEESITARTITAALNCVEPSWTREIERGYSKKWKDWAAFHNSSKFNSELVEV